MKHGDKVKEKIAKIPIGKGPFSYRKLHPDKPALTLIVGHSDMPCHYLANRTITVREAARIQGFDDDYIFHGGLRSQMNQVANAVPPKIGKRVGREMLAIFSKTDLDVFSVKKRSEVMARIRRRDTSPELAVRKIVSALGYRYRLDYARAC